MPSPSRLSKLADKASIHPEPNHSRNQAAALAPPPSGVDFIDRRLPSPGQATASPVAQLKRTRVTKAKMLPWTWAQNLSVKWRTHDIPLHPCHTTSVGQDQLVGGWTLIDDDGDYRQSGTYGPYSPTLGAKKAGHVERAFVGAMENALYADMGDDEGLSDDALAVIEINQWNTPCGGSLGCTTFLNNKIDEYNTWYDEVGAAGRLQAHQAYESSLSETHPRHPGLKKSEKKESKDDTAMDLIGGEIVHKDPWKY